LRREQPDALLSAADHANLIAIWAAKLAHVRSRIVISEHAVFSQAMRFAYGIRGRTAIRLAHMFYPQADRIVAVSQAAAEDLRTELKLAAERVEVIYNPIVNAELRQLALEPVQHAWFAPGAPPVILAAGRLNSQKDYPTLIRAFALARKDRSARLMILGEGEARPELEKLARELDLASEISLPGYVENPLAYMARAAVFVVSSLWESFSNVIVEALVAGAPVISTDCAGPREILQNGRYGKIVPCGNVEALEQAIRSQLGAKRNQVPSAALERFTQDAAVEAYIKVLVGDQGSRFSTER
jgi:glycosyltransferase involved in cell wall biosynthesis